MGLHMHVDKEDMKWLYKCVNSKMESWFPVAMGDGVGPFEGVRLMVTINMTH